MRYGGAVGVVLALSPASAAAWDSGHIGIYADSAATRACAEVPAGSYAFLYVIASRGENFTGDVSGVEFRIEVSQPQGWTFQYLAAAGSIMVGNPIDRLPADRHDPSGANVAFPACPQWDAAGHIRLGMLFVRNESGMPTELLVKRRSQPANRGLPCALFTSCDAPWYSTTCHTPRVAIDCDTFVPTPGLEGGGECDEPYFVFGLNQVPDAIWTTPPRRRDINREILTMLNRRTLIELPEGESEARLPQAIVREPALRAVLQRYAVEWVARAMPCFDLADTVAVTHGDTVRLTDWSLLWIFTLPAGASAPAFIQELAQLPQVVFAEPNGYAVALDSYATEFRAPNPLVSRGTLELRVERPMAGRVEIFDVRGRRVRVLLNRLLNAGSNQVVWDGTDDHGQRVRSGVYFVHVAAGARSSRHKLTFVR